MKQGLRIHFCAQPLAALLLLPATASAEAVELDCLIEPQSTVVVGSPVPGVIAKVPVERGARVEEGQVLVVLESSVERAATAAAAARAKRSARVHGGETRLNFEERRLTRSRKLSEEGVVSDEELDERVSAHLVADAALREIREEQDIAGLDFERQQALLALRTIRSPIRGVVVKRLREPGEYADDPRDLLELAQLDPLRVEAFAPVSAIGHIEEGMHAEVFPEEPVGGRHEARVVVVDRVVDAASGTFGVRLELPNPEFALPAGLKCRVRFPERPGPALPGAQ